MYFELEIKCSEKCPPPPGCLASLERAKTFLHAHECPPYILKLRNKLRCSGRRRRFSSYKKCCTMLESLIYLSVLSSPYNCTSWHMY